MSKRSQSLGYSYSHTQDTFSTDSLRAALCSCDAAKYQAELFNLRESTKAALQKSWAEVEAMQTQCSEYTERVHDLEVQLRKCEEEKNFALSRLSKTEKDINTLRHKSSGKMSKIASMESFLKLQRTPPQKKTDSHEIARSEHSFFSSYSNIVSCVQGNVDSFRTVDSQYNQTIEIDSEHSRFSSPESLRPTIISDEANSIDYQEECQLLKLKLSSRDKAIQSLESALELNKKTMQEMSNELHSLQSKVKRNTL